MARRFPSLPLTWFRWTAHTHRNRCDHHHPTRADRRHRRVPGPGRGSARDGRGVRHPASRLRRRPQSAWPRALCVTRAHADRPSRHLRGHGVACVGPRTRVDDAAAAWV